MAAITGRSGRTLAGGELGGTEGVSFAASAWAAASNVEI